MRFYPGVSAFRHKGDGTVSPLEVVLSEAGSIGLLRNQFILVT